MADAFFHIYHYKRVNDQMFSNRDPPIQYLLLTLLVTLQAVPACCEILTHVTKSTNCTITFDSAIPNDHNTGMQFVNCTRHVCLRNLANGNCANMQKFQFNQERCYQECCGSDSFDFMKCQSFNEQRKLKEESSQTRLAIILSASLVGVLLAVVIFAIFYLECCAKYEQPAQSKDALEKEFHWKDVSFTDEKCCLKCKQNGAFMLLSCGTYYHLKCMSSNESWECDHCLKTIKKVKVFCPKCLKKYIVIKASSFDELESKTMEMYSFHPSGCMEEMLTQMESERKFSVSTKQ